MASYDPPIVGKVGVRSGVSKKMAFGICCDTKKEALDKLRKRIGWDSAKWRWKTDSWNKADIKDYEEYENQISELIENYKEAFDKEEFLSKCTDYFYDYDYIVGDWAYGKLRLKGFNDKSNKNYNKIQALKEGYLHQYNHLNLQMQYIPLLLVLRQYSLPNLDHNFVAS